MGFVATILIGAAIGALGGYSTLGRRPAYLLILLAALGSFGALFTTYLGQDFGWNGPNEGAGPIGSVVGAFLVFAFTRSALPNTIAEHLKPMPARDKAAEAALPQDKLVGKAG
jgi:uncharacterized membrane protein YeaQ/YmgE (transglycosylase-associated protein family)